VHFCDVRLSSPLCRVLLAEDSFTVTVFFPVMIDSISGLDRAVPGTPYVHGQPTGSYDFAICDVDLKTAAATTSHVVNVAICPVFLPSKIRDDVVG
jgi:hypothetical protein